MWGERGKEPPIVVVFLYEENFLLDIASRIFVQDHLNFSVQTCKTATLLHGCYSVFSFWPLYVETCAILHPHICDF